MSSSRPGPVRRALPALLVGLVIGLAITEALLFALVRFPLAWLPDSPALPLARNLYRETRHIIQLRPELARPDPELLYTLRPGSGRFRNVEFDTSVEVNRLGLRDDEESLDSPWMVVLGDSHAMGWGVEGDETFAQLLEQRLDRRVLNAAISSYGTPRELAMLARVDRRGLEVVVIQFCVNDLGELNRFTEAGGVHRGSTPERYLEEVRDHRSDSRYLPGRYLREAGDMLLSRAKRLPGVNWLRWRIRRRLGRPPRSDPRVRRARLEARSGELFLGALVAHRELLEGRRVLVLELEAHGRNRDQLVTRLRELREAGRIPGWLELEGVEVEGLLDPSCRFVLDDHMNARGHRRVADRLLERLSAPDPDGW